MRGGIYLVSTFGIEEGLKDHSYLGSKKQKGMQRIILHFSCLLYCNYGVLLCLYY